MVPIVAAYLDAIDWGGVRHAIEIGSGTGPIARMMADRAPRAEVTGVEPSAELVSHAERLRGERPNLHFETGDGAALRHAPAPSISLSSTPCSVTSPTRVRCSPRHFAFSVGGARRLRWRFLQGQPGDRFAPPTARRGSHFAENFVTDRFLIGKLRAMSQAAGFVTRDFRVGSRLLTDGPQMGIGSR